MTKKLVQMKKLHIIFTLLFGVAVLLFFGLAYPHHLHYQEQYQLFLFDCSYVWDIVRLPGGVADLLGRFCTQFFLYAWVGAFIIALLLSAVQLLILRLSLITYHFIWAELCSCVPALAFPARRECAFRWCLGCPAHAARRLGLQ